jgi:hypothetical protein
MICAPTFWWLSRMSEPPDGCTNRFFDAVRTFGAQNAAAYIPQNVILLPPILALARRLALLATRQDTPRVNIASPANSGSLQRA